MAYIKQSTSYLHESANRKHQEKVYEALLEKQGLKAPKSEVNEAEMFQEQEESPQEIGAELAKMAATKWLDPAKRARAARALGVSTEDPHSFFDAYIDWYYEKYPDEEMNKAYWAALKDQGHDYGDGQVSEEVPAVPKDIEWNDAGYEAASYFDTEGLNMDLDDILSWAIKNDARVPKGLTEEDPEFQKIAGEIVAGAKEYLAANLGIGEASCNDKRSVKEQEETMRSPEDRAVKALDPRFREHMRVLTGKESPSYNEIVQALLDYGLDKATAKQYALFATEKFTDDVEPVSEEDEAPVDVPEDPKAKRKRQLAKLKKFSKYQMKGPLHSKPIEEALLEMIENVARKAIKEGKSVQEAKALVLEVFKKKV